MHCLAACACSPIERPFCLCPVLLAVLDTTTLEGAPLGVGIKPNGLKQLNAGEGGTILSSILTNTAEGLHLYLWSNTNATFEG
jgi:hypothetical protein